MLLLLYKIEIDFGFVQSSFILYIEFEIGVIGMVERKKSKQQKLVQYVALGMIIAFTLTIFGTFVIK